MKNKNLIVKTLLATVLLSGAFVSLADADHNVSDVTTPPELTAEPDCSAADLSDNSTISQGEEVLYTMQDNSTSTDDAQVPGEPEVDLIATQTSTPNNTLIVALIAVVLIIIGGTISVFFYPKKLN